jgi:hypothetical protein
VAPLAITRFSILLFWREIQFPFLFFIKSCGEIASQVCVVGVWGIDDRN